MSSYNLVKVIVLYTFALVNSCILPDGGWAEWVDDVFSTLIGQWTMKDQVRIENLDLIYLLLTHVL